MGMTRKETIEQIRRLVNFKFNDAPAPKKNESAAAPVKAKAAPAPIRTNEDGSPSLPDLLAEIADMREQIAVLGEWAALKDQLNSITKRVDQIQAGFAKMQQAYAATLQLMEQKDPAIVAKEKADSALKAHFDYHSSEARAKRTSKFFK